MLQASSNIEAHLQTPWRYQIQQPRNTKLEVFIARRVGATFFLITSRQAVNSNALTFLERVKVMKAENHAVVILGEILVDMYLDSVATSTDRKFTFVGTPGGAPANVAANLASMGIPSSFITSFSDDPLGRYVMSVLEERGIDMSLSSIHESKTPLAMVLSSPEGERSFRLYLSGSALERLDVSSASLSREISFFHFGSVLLVFEAGVKATRTLLGQVADRKTIRSYDINVRPDIFKLNPRAARESLAVLDQVDVLKLSSEDLEWIQKNADASLRVPSDFFKFGIKLIAYTEGANGSTLLTPNTSLSVLAPDVQVVDTTGSGDAFMAGILASLYEQNFRSRDTLLHLDEAVLRKIGDRANHAAKHILGQAGAMP